MAPEEADQGLGDHPDLGFGSKMEVKLSHSHHHLAEHNTAKIKSLVAQVHSVQRSANFECTILPFALVAKK